MQYPSFTPHVVSTTEHLTTENLMALYDQFTALGLMLLPRSRGQKFPIAKYWKNHEPITRDGVESDQHTTGNSGWCIVTGNRSGRVVALDFDTQAIKEGGNEPQSVLNTVQALSASLFAFTTPSGGLHLLYRQPEHQQLLTNSKTPIQGIDKRGEGGQVASVGSFVQYHGANAESKGVPDGHGGFYSAIVDGDYSTIPVMSDALYNWLLTTEKREKVKAEGETFASSEAGRKRLERHAAQPDSEQERITLEALEAVLHGWGKKPYEEWLRMWMSAYAASNGSLAVRDAIMMHPDVLWTGDPDEFRRSWDEHTPLENGYTAASLFWLARKSGFLTKTGMEIHDKLTTKINTRFIKSWVDTLQTLPERLLLMSQTGSGKTYTLKTLYERLNLPKTVVFVPSIKLALELTATLVSRHGLPAVCYYDQETQTSISVPKMVKAPILVTTLQTFATKLRVPMENYGLVYIEESDQLIAQFARGGGGQYSSQVSHKEAQMGFEALRQAFEKSAYVWCVDATMSNVTYATANAMSSKPVSVVKNTWVEPKAPVLMLESAQRALQEVLRALGNNLKVVAACDTATQAAEVVDVMDALGALEGKKAIKIIRNAEIDPNVVEFMEDVNLYAPKYDLVAYNSVMASGVSISDFQPDVIVQFCSYLTPRVNLQILNRYRKQAVVYCYYRVSENLYSRSDSQILDRAMRQAMKEGSIINLTVAQRTDDAALRSLITSISVSDSEAQNRSPRDFYMQLLQDDGRMVEEADATPVSHLIGEARKRVNEYKKANKEHLIETWRETPPINRDSPAPAGYTDEQIAQGELHSEIAYALRNNIPEGEDNRRIYEIVSMFDTYAVPLGSMIDQEFAIKKAEAYLADANRALTSMRNNLTLVKVVGLLKTLYPHMEDVLTDEQLTERAPYFLAALRTDREGYDFVIERQAQKYDKIDLSDLSMERKALAFAKIIMAKIGLKQKAIRVSQKNGEQEYGYSISNLREALLFLKWRHPELKASLDWGTTIIDDTYISRMGLTPKAINAIMAYMDKEHVSFDEARRLFERKEQF